eukprot:9071606-Lingulodinium_polyedra.AAC.1
MAPAAAPRPPGAGASVLCARVRPGSAGGPGTPRPHFRLLAPLGRVAAAGAIRSPRGGSPPASPAC